MENGNLVTQDIELISKYENFLLKKGAEEDKKRKYDYFHPSSFGQCYRKTAFQYYEFPKDEEFKPKARRIFSAGHAYHNRVQTEFAQMGILRGYWRCKICGKLHGKDEKWGIFCPRECDCKKHIPDDFPSKKLKKTDLFEYEEIQVENKEYHFKGHTDGIIEINKGEDGDRYVVDFKTINSKRFEFLSKPANVYVAQIRIYMWLLDINQGIIFYEEKDGHELKEFKILQDQDFIKDIKKTAKHLWDILQKKKLPAIPKFYKEDKMPCLYCDFKKKCWNKKKR